MTFGSAFIVYHDYFVRPVKVSYHRCIVKDFNALRVFVNSAKSIACGVLLCERKTSDREEERRYPRIRDDSPPVAKSGFRFLHDIR